MASILTARQVRIAIRSPGALARQLGLERLAPIDPDTPRSPQRQWISASIRRYVARGRDPRVLIEDYDARTPRAKRRETAASEIANGRLMLARFATLDQAEPMPTLVGVRRPMPVDVLGTTISMGSDLAYRSDDGWHLRHLITDREITRPEHLLLYATASALQFEGRIDGGPVTGVEVWMLRDDDRRLMWDRPSLAEAVGRLAVRPKEIARAPPDRRPDRATARSPERRRCADGRPRPTTHLRRTGLGCFDFEPSPFVERARAHAADHPGLGAASRLVGGRRGSVSTRPAAAPCSSS